MTTVSMFKAHTLEVSREIEASYHAKNMMDYLRGQVDATAWEANMGPLATGITRSNAIGDYTINWSLTEVDPLGISRRSRAPEIVNECLFSGLDQR